MRSFSLNKRLFLPIFLVFVILSLNAFPSQTRGVFHALFAPLEMFFWEQGSAGSSFFTSFFTAGSLAKEHARLKAENLELLGKFAVLQQAQSENETLKKALGLAKTKDFAFVLAPILGKDAGSDMLTIGLGENHAAKESMPVITKDKVLAGRVAKVSGSVAHVLLISHPDSSFDAKVSGKQGVSGVVRGTGSSGLLLDLVQKNSGLALGDTVVTSSLGGTFPPNLLVAKVGALTSLPAQPFLSAALIPLANVVQEDFLLLLTNF